MSSRKYRTYKFLYDTDRDTTVIKRQRSYLDPADAEITPITPLFTARVVNFNEKVTGTSQGLRHLLTYIDEGQFKANIPYNSNNQTNLVAHIEEILAVERVKCGDYRGETNITGGSTTSFSG